MYVQADAHFRMLPSDINNMYVRSANGEMVPFSAFVTSRWIYGSPRLERFTMGCHLWRSSVKLRQAKVPGKPWR
ncbi:efflux RND transporter permease subunit [Klebsiella pneumoniae subsp. pneumoniae]|nr:efflux RND transporter permease subunit [Klebsiella pneumoniae subsp. pneumoniae]